jgi:hypothetical protein
MISNNSNENKSNRVCAPGVYTVSIKIDDDKCFTLSFSMKNIKNPRDESIIFWEFSAGTISKKGESVFHKHNGVWFLPYRIDSRFKSFSSGTKNTLSHTIKII